MYKIKVITHFSAAHLLRNYKGKCEALHGHNWKVEVLVGAKELNPSGMVMDFGDLKAYAMTVLDELDHKYLNDLEYFSAKGGSASGGKLHNPSSEEIARYIFANIKDKISSKGCWLQEVRVWETENSCAMYSEDIISTDGHRCDE